MSGWMSQPGPVSVQSSSEDLTRLWCVCVCSVLQYFLCTYKKEFISKDPWTLSHQDEAP